MIQICPIKFFACGHTTSSSCNKNLMKIQSVKYLTENIFEKKIMTKHENDFVMFCQKNSQNRVCCFKIFLIFWIMKKEKIFKYKNS